MLTENERYEIKAEVFRMMTGHSAPGKDDAAATLSPESRQALFDLWDKAYGEAVWRTLAVASKTITNRDGVAR